jgi:hypothetical protein
MAYRGGALVKPIQVDYGAVAKIYSAGMAKVREIREGVLKERGEQTAALAKASDFVATGIQELDNLYLSSANIFREQTMDAIEANDRGDMTRSQLTALFARNTSQAQQLSKMPEIIKKNIEEIRKDDKLSDLTLDQYTNTWFVDRNTAGSYVDENGQEKTLDRSISLENDQNRGILVKGTYEIYDPISKKVYESEPIDKPLSQAINPSYKKWQKIDDDHVVKKIGKFTDVLGKRNFVGNDGKPLPYNFLQQIKNKNIFIKQTDRNVFKNSIETHINSQDRRFWESYAYEQLGVRSIGHSGYSGPLDKEKIKPFNNVYLDKDGNKISFEQEDDVFSFNRNTEGEISLQKKTLELAKAHYRDKVYSSLQIDQKELNLTDEEMKKLLDPDVLSSAVYMSKGKPQRLDKKHINSNLFIEMGISEQLKPRGVEKPGVDMKNALEQAMADMNFNGYTTSLDGKHDLPPVMNDVMEKGKKFSGVSLPKMSKGKEMKDILGDVLSFTGLKFNEINSFIVVDVGDGNPQVLLTGDASTGKKSFDLEGGEVKYEQEQFTNVSSATSKPLNFNQSKRLYQSLWNFDNAKEFFEGSGLTKDSNDYLTALKNYSDFINAKI